jgi:hypothetical protein
MLIGVGPGLGDLAKPEMTGLCKMMDLDFGEFTFQAIQ